MSTDDTGHKFYGMIQKSILSWLFKTVATSVRIRTRSNFLFSVSYNQSNRSYDEFSYFDVTYV